MWGVVYGLLSVVLCGGALLLIGNPLIGFCYAVLGAGLFVGIVVVIDGISELRRRE